MLDSKNQQTCILNNENIVAAFKIMRQNFGQSNLVSEANDYFILCENNPQFCINLMTIFNQSPDPLLKKQALALIKNIIKRRWGSNRKQQCFFTQQMKTKIKISIIELYNIHWKNFYKMFNQIFQYISKQDFPLNYIQLYEFIMSILNQLASLNIQSILNAEKLLPYLSTIKKVLKQYGIKRIKHQTAHYVQFIQPILHKSSQIFEKIVQALRNIISVPLQDIDHKLIVNLLECSRKIDKIIIYSVQCSTTQLQNNQLIVNLCRTLLLKLQFMLTMNIRQFSHEIQMNILALVQGLSSIQNLFPFIFTTFLYNYLNLVRNLLFTMNFEEDRLKNAIIIANKRPLSTYPYYRSSIEFQSSIYCKHGKGIYLKQQAQCHQIFNNFYGGQNVVKTMQKIVGQMMVRYQRQRQATQINFQQTQIYSSELNNNSQNGYPGQLLILLARQFLIRFKQPLKPFLCKIYEHLLQNMVISSQNPLINAMHEILLLLPKINDESYYDMDTIYNIIQKLYQIQDFLMFCRYIKNYQALFSLSILQKSFQILINIISHESMPHQVIYQSAQCLKKIINQNQQENLPLQTLNICLNNLFKMLSIYKSNHNHLWNLLLLINQFMKALSNEKVIVYVPLIMDNINILIDLEDNDIVTLQAITDMLDHVVQILTMQTNQNNIELRFQSNQLCIKHIQKSFSFFMNLDEGMGIQLLLRLWLTVMKNHDRQNSTEQFNQKLISIYQNLQEYSMKKYCILFCEILEEYMLSKLFILNNDDIQKIFEKLNVTGDTIQRTQKSENRNILAIYSIYYTYSILTNTYISNILIFCIKELRYLMNRISPTQNSLRTQIMLIINHHIVLFGASHIFELFHTYWSNNLEWFWPLVWSLDYVNHRYASKIITISLLSALDCLNDQYLLVMIEGYRPIDKIIKFCVNHLQPLKSQQAMISYMNTLRIVLHSQQPLTHRNRHRNSGAKSISRKIKLHVNKQISESDLKQICKQKLLNVLQRWNWTMQTIEQNYPTYMVTKIKQILKWSDRQLQNLSIK